MNRSPHGTVSSCINVVLFRLLTPHLSAFVLNQFQRKTSNFVDRRDDSNSKFLTFPCLVPCPRQYMWLLFFLPIDWKGRVSPRALTSLYAQQQAIGAMSLGPVDSPILAPSRALLHQIARQIPVVSSGPQLTKLESSDLPRRKSGVGVL